MAKDNTMIQLKNDRDKQANEDRRFKTTVNLKSSSRYAAAEFTPTKWLQDSHLIESDEEDRE